MTGFAKAETSQAGLLCQVEMRSVNHRHFEVRVFMPKAYSPWEEEFKKNLRSWIHRGKVDVQITLSFEGQVEERLTYDEKVLGGFLALKGQLEERIGQPLRLNLADLQQVKGLFTYQQPEVDEAMVQRLFQKTLAAAAKEMVAMRSREGELLAQEMRTRLRHMLGLIQPIAGYKKEITALYKKRLATAVEQAGGMLNPEDPRILQELGIFIDKGDITEELERFRAHLTHFGELLAAEVPIGRKLDFLLQEFNREANTLCSKAGHHKVAEIGVELKVEIEKLREQVQNIE